MEYIYSPKKNKFLTSSLGYFYSYSHVNITLNNTIAYQLQSCPIIWGTPFHATIENDGTGEVISKMSWFAKYQAEKN